ncbi:hypothetical protein LEN26_001975, partial [Aphanomyces euteiches]
MKALKTPNASSLPSDIVVKLAFFISEWSTVLNFLEALRPAKVLGPLEHLWQLHLAEYQERDLWPSLALSNSGRGFRDDLEEIAKFYSKVFADASTDLAWFCRIVHSAVSVHWGRSPFSFMSSRITDLDTLYQWKQIHIVSIEKNAVDPDLVFETLSCLQYLSEITWKLYDHKVAVAVFRYAASSSSLRKLALNDFGISIVISTSMTNNLLMWIASQPVQFISLKGFMWENDDLRHQLMTSALEKPSLDRFGMKEIHGSTWKFRGRFYRRMNL